MLTLTREPAKNNSEFCDKDVATAAQSLLGYQSAESLFRDSERAGRIVEWFLEKDIRPFEERSLKRFMRRKRWTEEAKTRWPFLAAFIVLASIAAVTIRTVTWGSGAELLAVFCGVTCFGALATLIGAIVIDGWTWNTIWLANYSKPIPEFALQTAIDIAGKFPDMVQRLYVVELQRDSRTADPFLAAVLPGGQELFLEVWDEPGFRRAREV